METQPSSLQLPPLGTLGGAGMQHQASSKEVSFRRLLHSTEQQVACLLQELAADPQAQGQFLLSAAKLRHFLASLEDQLGDLDRLQGSLGLSPDKLSQYHVHVKQLASKLPPPNVPRYCQPPARKAAVPPALSATNLAAAARSALSTPLPQELSGEPVAAQGSDATQAQPPRGGGPLKLGLHAQQQLRAHEDLQDQLTDELVGMAAAMKQGALGLQAAVQARGELVDKADVQLDNNVHGAQQLVKGTAKQYKRSSAGFCFTCMVLLAVGLIFTAMTVYIKLTYFIGYRTPASSGGSSSWLSSIMSLLPRRGVPDDEL